MEANKEGNTGITPVSGWSKRPCESCANISQGISGFKEKWHIPAQSPLQPPGLLST